MRDAAVDIQPVGQVPDILAAHRLLVRRIGPHLVEDADSFVVTASRATSDWEPLLLVAWIDGRVAGAQLGGLLPGVGLLSLPYTAVDEPYEGRGMYRALKTAMLARLHALAAERGLRPPAGNVSEEVVGSEQYRRKVERGTAAVFPFRYLQPAVQGLPETPLALTYEPLDGNPPPLDAGAFLRTVTALYRGLYRIGQPEADPTFRRIAEDIRAV